jgi:hypothetical protein
MISPMLMTFSGAVSPLDIVQIVLPLHGGSFLKERSSAKLSADSYSRNFVPLAFLSNSSARGSEGSIPTLRQPDRLHGRDADNRAILNKAHLAARFNMVAFPDIARDQDLPLYRYF